MRAMPGTVYLVGAGPGDPGLLTLAAAELLATADVVLYDALVGDGVLALIHPGALTCAVGKRGGEAGAGQQDIEERLLGEARRGRSVVRLKGGDPFVFGRGGEEAQACARAAIPFVVVPGISSAVAGPAYAGIPVTHRGIARSFAVVTGTTDSGADTDLAAVAAVDTLVVLMAARKLEKVAARLIEAGRPPDTPVAVIESATTPAQRVTSATLATLAAVAEKSAVRPPALLVVGDVAALAGELAWFRPGPLHGKRVVVTTTPDHAPAQARLLAAQHAAVTTVPAIVVDFPAASLVASALAERCDWLVLPSRNAVNALAAALRSARRDARALAGARIAVAGPGTAEELARHGLVPDFAPTEPGASGIASGLPLEAGEHVLLLQSNAAPGDLAAALGLRGAIVRRVDAYRTVPRDVPPAEAAALIAADAITFASPSAVQGVAAAVSSLPTAPGLSAKLIAIGPTTGRALRETFGRCDGVAHDPSPEGLVQAVLEASA